MQTIELKQIDDGYFFQCGICNQFPKLPLECIYCNQWYCYDCRNFLHTKERRGCDCQLEYLELYEPFQQYVYSRLTIKCQICNQLQPINKSKRHQIKCQYQLSNQQLLIDKGFNNFNLIQKSSSQIPCPINHNQTYDSQNFKYCINLKCEQYSLLLLKQSYIQTEKLSEDDIIQVQSIIFQCKLCLDEGNLFLMRQHHLSCKQEIVTCICGLNYKRESLKDHIYQCLKEYIIVNQINNEQISYIINLQIIAFYQQLVQNRHDFQLIFFNKQFQSLDQDYRTWLIMENQIQSISPNPQINLHQNYFSRIDNLMIGVEINSK
ncbi:hypothetical protein pb186bvf_009894 [Paramecium bursaria]